MIRTQSITAKPMRIGQLGSNATGRRSTGCDRATVICGNAACMWPCPVGSDAEDFRVALLDLIRLLLDGGRVVFHDLDVLERGASRFFLGLRMHGAQPP